VDILEKKLGEDIVLLDIKEVANFTDYFVIASGTSDRMLDRLCDSVLREIKTNYKKNTQSEGFASSGWMVLDYGDVVVHLFSPEKRDYYQLEDLWNDGKVILHLQ